ncbi:cysteine-rich RLK (RECEPTOR-like protein kinase) 8 [Striga hermonthica]|uniref:Cysteine-rich RLK (RECEPTOR-like protein kinase) 8 n=1 Tax=Striga hermonthica TaxID=68872 RepID=A0A9N7MIH3_STRHE|nr:cysteine-rich RLK (RECEPTOR-like protein kinase) 8 [Striga hermonthica]
MKCWWRPDIKCRKCGNMGHMERVCKSQQPEASKAQTEEDEEQLFVVTCFASKNNSSESWLIDSGCTNHMTNNLAIFIEIDMSFISNVRIGNGQLIPVKGKGIVAIESLSGLKHIYDVLYVPDIDQNLLSVGQLLEKDYKVIFDDKWCFIKDALGKDVFMVMMKAKSFSLNLLEDEQRNDYVKGVPLLEEKLADCVACQYGKQIRKPFPQTTWRASHKLQLVHSDVGGPQRTSSLNGSDEKPVNVFKADMFKTFEMTYLGLLSYFLGMEVKQGTGEVFICQQKFAKEILKKFHMEDCKEISTPMNLKEILSKEDGAEKVDEGLYRSLIGCLMYLTATRPDITFVVSLLSRFMNCASKIHFVAAKRVLRYVKGTTDYDIKYSVLYNFQLQGCHNFQFQGFSDSDWAGSIDDMRSTTGYCFSFGSGAFSWSSKKQDVVAQSTAKAKFIAANAAVNQAIWIRKILEDLHMKQTEPTEIFVDNQTTIAISKDPVFHGKTKHFNIRLYHLREKQKDGEINSGVGRRRWRRRVAFLCSGGDGEKTEHHQND